MEKMYKLTFQPQAIVVKVPYGAKILEAAIQNNIPLEGPCNGRGTCGKCIVSCKGMLSEPSEEEKRKLGPKLEERLRLACQAKVYGDTEVIISEKQAYHTVDAGKSAAYDFDPPFAEIIVSREQAYGLAIDIGTTSVVATLIDFKANGRAMGTASCLNPQTQYGGDVLTRITFAHEQPENAAKLQRAIISGLNGLIDKICTDCGIDYAAIVHAAIAANTTMMHLLVGIDPISLAVAPYSPVFVEYRNVKASDTGLKLSDEARISLLPSLSAFVGADILAGVIAIDYQKVKVPALFIDIGTNGEIVANVRGKLAATSSAAGPALEGMNIQFGCRAEDGAISAAKITENNELVVESIGSGKRKGICGSGLIDLVAEFVKHKVVHPSGKFTESGLPKPLAERIIDFEGQKAFLIDAETGIVLTQRDIRQVQLAKGAIAAAITILFKRLGLSLEEVEKVYIAGAFGYHLKPEALLTIGLLPPGLQGQIEFVGNTAKEGAGLCLTSNKAFLEIQRLQQEIDPVELSYAPEFQENYVEQMGFPVTKP